MKLNTINVEPVRSSECIRSMLILGRKDVKNERNDMLDSEILYVFSLIYSTKVRRN